MEFTKLTNGTKNLLSKVKTLIHHRGFLKYFHNTSWLLIERILKMFISFFIIILLTRYLGPENFGLLSYAQSVVGIFAAFSTLGIDVILVRELTKNQHNSSQLLGTAITMKLVASLIALITIFLINLNIEDKEAVLLTNIIAITLVFQSISSLDTYFQAHVISKFTVITNLISFTISAITKLILLFFQVKLVYFAYALVFDSIILSLGYLYIYVKQGQSLITLEYNNKTALYFIKSGWPLMLVALAAFIYTRTDQIMLKYLIGEEAVGNYAAAVRISELFYFIPLLVTQSIFPKVITTKQNSEVQYFKLLEHLYKILVWSAIPIALILFIFSNTIVTVLYGEAYNNAANILRILAFGVIFNAIGTITTKVLYTEHYERKYLYRSILGVFVNIILNLWLIQFLGIQGAAISTLITLFIIFYIYDIFDKDLHKFYYLKLICFIPINIKSTR